MKWEKFIQAGIRLPYYMNLYIQGKLTNAPRVCGWDSRRWLVQTEKQLTTVYFNPQEIEAARAWLKKNIHKPQSLEGILQKLQQIENRLLNFARELSFKNLPQYDNRTLGRILSRFSALFRAKFGVYGFPKIIDDAASDLLPDILSISQAPFDCTRRSHLMRSKARYFCKAHR